MGGWRKLHNEELRDLYSSPSVVRVVKSNRMRWALHVAQMRENKNALLVGKPKRKRPLERPRWRWLDNIKMDLGEIGWGDVDWIGLAQDRNRWRALVNSVMNLRLGNYRVATQLVASRIVLSSIELVSKLLVPLSTSVCDDGDIQFSNSCRPISTGHFIAQMA
jgi:hypothetical protein